MSTAHAAWEEGYAAGSYRARSAWWRTPRPENPYPQEPDMSTTHEEFFIDFRPDVSRSPELGHMEGMNGPYPSYAALEAAWGDPASWNPPLKIMSRTVTTTNLKDYTP